MGASWSYPSILDLAFHVCHSVKRHNCMKANLINLDGWGPEAVKSGDPGLLSLMSITFDISSRTTCGVHIPRAEHKGLLQRKAL